MEQEIFLKIITSFTSVCGRLAERADSSCIKLHI